jgi:hypothetical protein
MHRLEGHGVVLGFVGRHWPEEYFGSSGWASFVLHQWGEFLLAADGGARRDRGQRPSNFREQATQKT